MQTRLMSMRGIATGVILLVMASSIALPGCAIVVSHYNGHWETKNGQKVCEPGGSQCTVVGIDTRKSIN